MASTALPTSSGRYTNKLTEALQYSGLIPENKRFCVVEMDLAIDGLVSQPEGFHVYLSRQLTGGTHSIARFALFDETFARYIEPHTVEDVSARQPATRGEFGHLKVVIDRETKLYSYYWNTVLVATALDPIHGTTPDLGFILFNIPHSNEPDSVGLYVDNINVYLSDDFECTQTYEVININFDNYAIGQSIIDLDGGSDWSGYTNAESYASYGHIAAKTEVDPSASSTDRCLLLICERADNKDLNFGIELNKAKVVTLGKGSSTHRMNFDELCAALAARFPEAYNVLSNMNPLELSQVLAETYNQSNLTQITVINGVLEACLNLFGWANGITNTQDAYSGEFDLTDYSRMTISMDIERKCGSHPERYTNSYIYLQHVATGTEIELFSKEFTSQEVDGTIVSKNDFVLDTTAYTGKYRLHIRNQVNATMTTARIKKAILDN